MDTNRICALEVLNAIEKDSAYSNLALNLYLKKYNIKETGFVRQVVYGVLENRIYIDYILSLFVKTGVDKMKIGAKNILRMGVYQINYMEHVPSYAAINESVELAKKFAKGQQGFVNGVLRNYLRQKQEIALPNKEENYEKWLSLTYSYEIWMIKYWMQHYGAGKIEGLLGSGNQVPPLTARVNLLKTSKENIIEELTQKGYEVTEGKNAKESIHVKGTGLLDEPAFQKGMIQIQDESSMMAVDLLNPQPGDLLIDVCAAPGGKTIFAGEKMKNQGKIIACDIHGHKLELLQKTAKKHGLHIVDTAVCDARNTMKHFLGSADRVVADVPCSGLGVIRRKPEIKYTKSMEDIEALSKIQKEILCVAASYVKPGGTLVYSTCTISLLENDQVVEAFLKENPFFVLEEKKQLTPLENQTDGFFMCKLLRSSKNT